MNAENVAEAIVATGPFAVDSASGTESAPGKKDEQKLRAFFAAVESRTSAEESAPEGAADLPISLAEPNKADDGTERIAAVDAPSEGAAA